MTSKLIGYVTMVFPCNWGKWFRATTYGKGSLVIACGVGQWLKME